jgi:hypothetical protein
MTRYAEERMDVFHKARRPFGCHLLALALLLWWSRPGEAKQDLPIIKANSKLVTVTDGFHVRKAIWNVMPERKPDVYHVEIPMHPHTVTFTTDVDSISFPVAYGEHHDFIILLNNQETCHTQIRAAFRNLKPSQRVCQTCAGGEKIPFTLGDNDKIYIKGKPNNGDLLDLQFDLGASGGVVKKGSVEKANLRFDGTVTLHNSDGANVVPSSSNTHLEIGHLRWDGLDFAVGDNMTHREDAIVGNSLFQDKVVEINYDQRILTIHDTLPLIDASYSKHDLILDQGVVPFVQGSVMIGSRKREGWFMFDTGAYTSILKTDQASAASKLLTEFRSLAGGGQDGRFGPRLTVGGQTFANFNYSIKKHKKDDGELGLLGGDIIKRFNVILDNQHGAIYLQKNTLWQQPFRNPEYYLARFIVLVAVALVCTAGFLMVRKRRIAPKA